MQLKRSVYLHSYNYPSTVPFSSSLTIPPAPQYDSLSREVGRPIHLQLHHASRSMTFRQGTWGVRSSFAIPPASQRMNLRGKGASNLSLTIRPIQQLGFLLKERESSNSSLIIPPASLESLPREYGRSVHVSLYDRYWVRSQYVVCTHGLRRPIHLHIHYLISQRLGDSTSPQGWRVQFIFFYTTLLRARYNAPSPGKRS